MTVWFQRIGGIDTNTMREIGDIAGVSWSTESIVYRGKGIGYAEGNSSDATAIQDAAESLIGIRPVEIDAPSKPDPE